MRRRRRHPRERGSHVGDKKKPEPESIPLERAIAYPGYERNSAIERKRLLMEALEAEQTRLAKERLASKDSQRKNSQGPRGQGADGRTMRQLVADVARKHPDADTPEKLW